MNIILHMVPTAIPITLLIYSRVAQDSAPDTTPIGSPITGIPVTNRTNLYEFNLGALSPGDYELYTTGIYGFWVLELASTSYRIGDSWEELEASNVSITTEYFLNQEEVDEEDELVFYNSEVRIVAIVMSEGVFDGDPMTFKISDEQGEVIATVTGITSITNTALVTIPSTPKHECLCLTWSLRKTTGGTVVKSGPAIQRYAP